MFFIYNIFLHTVTAKDYSKEILLFRLFFTFIGLGWTFVFTILILNIVALIKYREHRIPYLISMIVTLPWFIYSVNWYFTGVLP